MATADFTIEVTPEDIERGTLTPEGCPIALAIYRRTGVVPYVDSGGCIFIPDLDDPDAPDHFHGEPDIESWIAAFDRHEQVEPSMFTLYLRDDE